GNVVTLRNCFQDSVKEVLEKAYIETVTYNPQYPVQVPKLLEKAYSINEVVKVDFYIPGCPPSADLINYVITEFLEGRVPSIEEKFKYG
ncbi:MAG: NADP oxidoreductase, partial [Crenarchaeota archaeon]|nr:NADP oxidoreductase [Thermoproteota archaeon]